MRALYIAIPAGLALATAGGALMLAAKRPEAAIVTPDPLTVPGAVRHFVTPQMTEETEHRAQSALKPFKVKDSEGKWLELAPGHGSRPQFVYFVLDGCPCSYDAEPLFHKLYKRFRGKVDFIAVTNGTKSQAHDWSVQLLVNYPVVPDPTKEIIRSYGARASVYSILIGPDGRVVKMWPGYSADLLQDINSSLARAAKTKPEPFDTEYAPKTRATGCAF